MGENGFYGNQRQITPIQTQAAGPTQILNGDGFAYEGLVGTLCVLYI